MTEQFPSLGVERVSFVLNGNTFTDEPPGETAMNQGIVDTSAITTLTFDVVGTVIDFETGILEWWRPHLEGQGIRIDDAGILAAFAEAEDRLQRQRPDLPFTDMLPLIYRDLAETWALNGGEEAAGDFQSSIAHWPAFPDSEEALRTLSQHFRLVAMTNADAWATRAMNRTVGNLFDDQVTCDEVGVNKPDQRFFQYVLDRIGVAKEEVLHFAQSQYHDIGGAKRFGLTTAWVERRHGKEGGGATPEVGERTEPDIHVHSLAELAEFLRQE